MRRARPSLCLLAATACAGSAPAPGTPLDPTRVELERYALTVYDVTPRPAAGRPLPLGSRIDAVAVTCWRDDAEDPRIVEPDVRPRSPRAGRGESCGPAPAGAGLTLPVWTRGAAEAARVNACYRVEERRAEPDEVALATEGAGARPAPRRAPSVVFVLRSRSHTPSRDCGGHLDCDMGPPPSPDIQTDSSVLFVAGGGFDRLAAISMSRTVQVSIVRTADDVDLARLPSLERLSGDELGALRGRLAALVERTRDDPVRELAVTLDLAVLDVLVGRLELAGHVARIEALLPRVGPALREEVAPTVATLEQLARFRDVISLRDPCRPGRPVEVASRR